MTLTFDLLTPKVDRFVSCPIMDRWPLLFSKYLVHKFGHRQTNERTNRQLTAQKCYVHFLTKLRFWYQIIGEHFPISGQKREILILYWNEEQEQELSYHKQIARQLRPQFVDGVSVTLKSTLRVTQGHWKRNHWTDHTRLTIRRVTGRWILSWPWNVGQRSFKFIESGTIWKFGYGILTFPTLTLTLTLRLRVKVTENGAVW